MEELEQLHITLHQEIQGVVILVDRGDKIRAEQAYMRIDSISDRMASLLDQLNNLDRPAL